MSKKGYAAKVAVKKATEATVSVIGWFPIVCIAALIFVLICAVIFFLLIAVSKAAQENNSDMVTSSCEVSTSMNKNLPDFSPAQLANAKTIVAVAFEEKLGKEAAVIGVATALVESRLDNTLTPAQSDRDSAGMFQQRALWGPLEDRMDPRKSTLMFFNGGAAGQRGLKDFPNWKSVPVFEAAQDVQVSCCPQRYAQEESLARLIISSIDTFSLCENFSTSLIGSGKWTTPVRKGNYVLTSRFGPRSSPGGIGSTNHKGLDFGVPIGTEVLAASDGIVSAVRREADSGGFGNLLIIDHEGGKVQTFYAHLSAIKVGVGDTVKGGQLVALSGNTGNSTGPHLHFQTMQAGVPVNPETFLKTRGVNP